MGSVWGKRFVDAAAMLVDSFLPLAVRSGGEERELVRYRGWVRTALVIILVSSYFCGASLVWGAESAVAASLGFLLFTAGVIVQLLAIRDGWPLNQVHLAAIGTMSVLAWLLSQTGGVTSPFTVMMLVGALVISNFGPPRQIVLMFAVFTASILLLHGLEGARLLPEAPDLQTRDWHLAALLGAVVVGLAGNISAQAARRQARRMLREARDAAEERQAQAEAAQRRAETALADLRAAQEQIVLQEKLASLGGLVAGVAHEVSAPVGIVITGISQLRDEIALMRDALGRNAVSRTDLEEFLKASEELCRLTQANGRRAADLIGAFKEVAADQSSEGRRNFDLAAYVREVLASLSPRLRPAGHRVEVAIEDGLVVDSYPGPLAQVLTNLVLNSLLHGYEEGRSGILRIEARRRAGGWVELVYSDDGRGIPRALWPRVFEPFFTTRRGHGGTGIGLHLVWTIVTGTLGGQVQVEEAASGGARFVVRFPSIAPERRQGAED